MSYSNTEALDMMLILGQCGGQFRAVARLWQERYPDRTLYLHNVFSRLSKRITNKAIIQPDCNKGRQIRHPVRVERTPEILEFAQLHPHESLKCVEQESGVSRNTTWRIYHENKLHLDRMTLH